MAVPEQCIVRTQILVKQHLIVVILIGICRRHLQLQLPDRVAMEILPFASRTEINSIRQQAVANRVMALQQRNRAIERCRIYLRRSTCSRIHQIEIIILTLVIRMRLPSERFTLTNLCRLGIILRREALETQVIDRVKAHNCMRVIVVPQRITNCRNTRQKAILRRTCIRVFHMPHVLAVGADTSISRVTEHLSHYHTVRI